MSAIPAPPKTETTPPVGKKPKQLSERLQNNQALNDLRDALEFAPKGEEHKPR